MNFKFILFFIFAGIFIENVSYADILFIDFNLNDKEIISAQKVANQYSEKLVVFPSVSAEIRKTSHDLDSYKAIITEKIKACGYDSACVKTNLDLYSVAQKKQDSLLSKIPFGAQELLQFLKQMDREGRSFSTFIESGHAGAERFSGVFANGITHEELFHAVEGVSSLSSVRYVLYWGCYTMTIGAVKNRWPKIFPNAHLIAGFDDLGPLGIRVESGALLEQVLLRQSEAISMGKNLSNLKVFFKSLQYSQTTNFAISIDYNTYVSNHHVLLISDAVKMCSADEYLKYANIVKCFAEAKTTDCANPPQNVVNGVLNKSYLKMRDMDHCFDENTELLNPADRIEVEYVLRLMDFTNVKQNYARFHARDLSLFDEALTQAQVSSSLHLSNMANMTRLELVKRIQSLVDLSPSLPIKLQEAIAAIQYSMVVINIKSIPPAWISPFAKDGIPTQYDKFKM